MFFYYWSCYRSKGSRIGLRIAVLAWGEAEGQYNHPKACATGRGPVKSQCENIDFMTFLLINFFFNFLSVENQ